MKTSRDSIFFSVIIPTFNRIESLRRSLDSLVNQTYRNFEVIVVDDYYTEPTSNFINVDSYNFGLTIIRNQKNLGPAGSRNKGILNSKFDWIAFLDDDDEWEKNKLESVADEKNEQ